MRKMLTIGIIGVLTIILLSPYTMGFANVMSEHTINHNTIVVNILNNNPVDISPSTPNYTPIPSSQTIAGETYNTIIIDNAETDGEGIADANGQVNVEFSLNDNRPFCIAVSHFDGDNSKLKMDVTINGIEYHYTSVLSGNITQYIGMTAKYFTLSTLIDEENWIISTDPIQFSIHNFTDAQVPETVTVSILFI